MSLRTRFTDLQVMPKPLGPTDPVSVIDMSAEGRDAVVANLTLAATLYMRIQGMGDAALVLTAADRRFLLRFLRSNIEDVQRELDDDEQKRAMAAATVEALKHRAPEEVARMVETPKGPPIARASSTKRKR